MTAASKWSVAVRWLASLILYRTLLRWGPVRGFAWNEQAHPNEVDDLPCQNYKNGSQSAAGLRVLNAGLMKTGTTSVHHALQDLGLRAYFTADTDFFLYGHFKRTDSGEAATAAHAEAFRRCGMDALSLDGRQYLLEEIYAPGMKVILTERSYDEVMSSARWYFKHQALVWSYLVCPLADAGRFLPYGPLIRSWMKLCGHTDEIQELLANGGPELTREVSTYTLFMFLSNWATISGRLQRLPRRAAHPGFLSPEAWAQYYEKVKMLVPKTDLLVFDVKRHGWQDLTRFLGIPLNRTGRLPNARPSLSLLDPPVLQFSTHFLPARTNIEGMYICMVIWTFLHILHLVLISQALGAALSTWKRAGFWCHCSEVGETLQATGAQAGSGHLVVLAPEQLGDATTLRLLEHLQAANPAAEFLVANSAVGDDGIVSAGAGLALEICSHWALLSEPRPCSWTLIAIGSVGLAARAAVPQMQEHWSKLHMLVTVNTPHLGLFPGTRWKAALLLQMQSTPRQRELMLQDTISSPADAAVFRLSKGRWISLFKHTLLVHLAEDRVPQQSAACEELPALAGVSTWSTSSWMSIGAIIACFVAIALASIAEDSTFWSSHIGAKQWSRVWRVCLLGLALLGLRLRSLYRSRSLSTNALGSPRHALWREEQMLQNIKELDTSDNAKRLLLSPKSRGWPWPSMAITRKAVDDERLRSLAVTVTTYLA